MQRRPTPYFPSSLSKLLHLLVLNHSNNYASVSTTPEPRSRACTDGSYLVYCNSLIGYNGRKGNLEAARLVFDRMRVRDVVSWTAMLTAYADNGDILHARRMFDQMPERNTVSWNAMVTTYSRGLKIAEAFDLFSRMPVKNVVSYASMITGFARTGMFREALEVYDEMPPSWRDPVASNALICGYLSSGELEEAIRIFEGMAVKDVVSWSSMVDGYCKYGGISEAREVFDEMPLRNVVSWTAMIRGYMKNGMWDDGFQMFSRMRREGVGINSTTLSVVLDACAKFGRSEEGCQIHGLVLRMGFKSDVFLGNSIIAMYSRSGWMNAARKVFNTMRRKDVVSWNSIIMGYVQHDMIEEACMLFETMPEKDVVSWTSMLVGFSKRGLLEESVRLFEHMPEKDSVAWTTIVSGFAGNGKHESAFLWFDRMLREGIRPNPLVLSSVLSALSNLAILKQGIQVHAFVVKMQLEFDALVQTSLVSMYAKCGDLADAYQIYSTINEPSIVSMNSMIVAFGRHGFAEEAIRLFREMLAKGYNPNEVTFLGILSACAHAGLVDEGYDYFKLMTSSYDIEPNPDHYTCMVDLLGRAGLFKEAVNLIHSMPCSPNSAIWGALLNASRMHFNLVLAQLAAQRLFELEPNNAATYAVLSSMYSVAGMKKEEEELRVAKQSKGLMKAPGCSWIVLDKSLQQSCLG